MSISTGKCFWLPSGMLTFLVMTLGEMPCIYGNNNEPVTIETIIKTWRERESKARSLDFVTEGTESRPSATFSVSLLEGMGTRSEKPISISDTSFHIRLRLAIDGNGRYRMDYDGKDVAPTEKGYPDDHHVEIFENGVLNLIYYPVEPSEYPSAHIKKESIPTRVLTPQWLPIRIVYRPFDSEIGVFDSSKLTLTKDKGVVEDRQCLVLKHKENTIWVDPARDFVPTRYYEIEKGITTRFIDIKYTADARHGWVPASWSNVSESLFSDGQDSVTTTVKEYKIGQSISKEIFEVKYPPGTWVRDYSKDESYILREDGSRRMVPHSEDGKDYGYLLHTNPPGENRHLWIYSFSILLLVIVTAVFYRTMNWRRRNVKN